MSVFLRENPIFLGFGAPGVLQMGTFGRTWEALGVQSGALGAFFGIQVSSWIFDRLLSQISR